MSLWGSVICDRSNSNLSASHALGRGFGWENQANKQETSLPVLHNETEPSTCIISFVKYSRWLLNGFGVSFVWTKQNSFVHECVNPPHPQMSQVATDLRKEVSAAEIHTTWRLKGTVHPAIKVQYLCLYVLFSHNNHYTLHFLFMNSVIILKEQSTAKWNFSHYLLTPVLMESWVMFHNPQSISGDLLNNSAAAFS